MPTALHIAGLPSQPHHGVGARLVRRLGGAVRSVIVRGITLAGTLRRPAAPQTSPAAAQHPDPRTPTRLRAPHRPPTPSTSPAPRERSPAKRAGEGAAPLLPPWLVRLLADRRRHPAPVRRPAFLNQGDAPFTLEAFPQLSPKACAVLNTPLKDCDPKTLELLVSTFTQYINQVMSPEAGITDPTATFPDLWHRISTALADTNLDTSSLATPEAVAVPDAPLASPHPPAPPTAPTRLWTNYAPRVSPLPLSGPPASDPPADATITPAAPKTPPEIAAPSAPVVHRSRSFRYHTQSSPRWCRRDSQPSLPRRIRVYLCASVVPFSCCHYAASTGPP